MRVSQVGTAFAGAALSLGLLVGPAAPLVASAVPASPYSSALWAVDGVSPTDLWAVGNKVPAGGDSDDMIPLIKHYDGRVWHTVHTDVGVGQLYSVSAAASDDVWAVGEAHRAILVLHWDGVSWQQVSTPSYPGFSDLYNVDVIAPDRVVASGFYHNGECPCYAISLVWDGSTWSEDSGLESSLYVASALSPTDAWGAGSIGIDPPTAGVAAHWNGKRWKDTHPISVGRGFRIAAIADDDVWLTGLSDSGLGFFFQHWDGHDWTVVDDAAPPGFDVITGVSGSGPDDVWATGYTLLTGLLEHWDGSTWSNVDNPVTRSDAELHDVLALSATDAWAVGNLGLRQVLMHWTGHVWRTYHRPH